jgi:signal peptidase II
MFKKFLITGLSLFVIFSVDQLIKFWVLNNLGNQIKFGYFFSLLVIKNAGISFGLFGGSFLGLILTILGIVFLCFLVIFYLNFPISFLGAGLALGGGVSNLIDRFIHAAVIDYISFLHYPAFNLADISIFCGTALIIYSLFKNSNHSGVV